MEPRIIEADLAPEIMLIYSVVDQAIRDYTDRIPESLLSKPSKALRYDERVRIAGHLDAVRWVHSPSPQKEWISFNEAMRHLGIHPDLAREALRSNPDAVRARLADRMTTVTREEAA